MLEFAELWQTVKDVMSLPVARFALCSFCLALSIRTLVSIFSCMLDLDHGFLFPDFGGWVIDKLIDLLKKLFGFDFIYKLGLARPGIDFVDCDSCFCSECSFRDSCPPERRAEMASMKGEDLTDG